MTILNNSVLFLSYLAKKFNCRTSQLKTPMMLDLIKALNQLLLKHEVSLPYTEIKDTSDSVGSDLNHRRIFLKWEKSLTDEKNCHSQCLAEL